MEDFYTIDQFGPYDAVKLIAKKFSFLDDMSNFNPKSLKDPRDELSYGSTQAKAQWAFALRDTIPDPSAETCFICGLDFDKKEDWRSPQIEHLFPSAFAFLLFGLPGKFHLKWKDERDESSKIITNTATEFGELMRDLQVKNYQWCHAHCNRTKRDSIFIKIINSTKGCFDLPYPCTIRINSGKDIRSNTSSINKFIDKLFGSSDSARLWKRSYKGDRDDISMNIAMAFVPLVNKLREYDEETIMTMIKFNLYIGLSIIYKYLGKPIPVGRANRLNGMKEAIKLAIENGGVMEGGGKEYFKEMLTKEEFEEFFLHIGKAIKHFADLPYPGKEDDDAFIKEYIVQNTTEEEPVNIRTLEIVPRLNVNNMPGLRTPARLATPIRTKRSRNNNINQNNMRNENYISKTLALKKPRVTRNFRPNRRAFAPLGQIAGKYKKTRKNRK